MRRAIRIFVVLAVITAASGWITRVAAVAPSNDYFHRTWARTDKVVADGLASRTWMWGPEAFTLEGVEDYAGAPGGTIPGESTEYGTDVRAVQYFDKSRMEITDPGGDTSSPWYVTNGLLVVELITGRMQLGDNKFVERGSANVNVAGDADDQYGATYKFFKLLLDEPASPEGSVIDRILTPGAATNAYLYSDEMGAYGVTASKYVPATSHTVADKFWEFMNSWGLVYENGNVVNAPLFQDPFYATGYPITEAYWGNVKVGGEYKDVLIQCFERRCLTFTPSNNRGWQVEAGNVGRHYFTWRYGNVQTEPPDNATPSPPTENSTMPSGYRWIATGGGYSRPMSVELDLDDNLYVVDSLHNSIVKFDPTGERIFHIGTASVGLEKPVAIATELGDAESGFVFALDQLNDRVVMFIYKGSEVKYMGAWPLSEAGYGSSFAQGIVADSAGNVFVTGGSTIAKFTVTGELQGQITTPASYFWGIAIGPLGNLFATDFLGDSVYKYSADGGLIDVWYGFDDPSGITVDEAGFVYVADSANNRIVKLTNGGAPVTTIGEYGANDGQFNKPRGVAVDSFGNVFVADTFNDRIQVFVPGS